MYDIQFDPHKRLLTITPDGFWNAITTAKFAAEIMSRSAYLRLRHGPCAVLVDLRQVPIQAADTISGLERLIVMTASLSVAPIAAVVGSTLAKMQFKRAFSRPNCQVFLDMDEAHSFLQEHWFDLDDAKKRASFETSRD